MSKEACESLDTLELNKERMRQKVRDHLAELLSEAAINDDGTVAAKIAALKKSGLMHIDNGKMVHVYKMSEHLMENETNRNIKKYFLAPGLTTVSDVSVEYFKFGKQSGQNGEQVAFMAEAAITTQLGLENLTNIKIGGGGQTSSSAEYAMGAVGLIVATPNPCTPTQTSIPYQSIPRKELRL